MKPLLTWAQAQPFWPVLIGLLDKNCIVVLHAPNLPEGATRLGRKDLGIVQFVNCMSPDWHIVALGEYGPAMLAIADAAAAPHIDMRETNEVLANIVKLVKGLGAVLGEAEARLVEQGVDPTDLEESATIAANLQAAGLWSQRHDRDFGEA